MKRKTSTTPSRVYTYRIRRPPAVNAQLFHQQLFLSNRYYNALIEIERWRREEYRKARSEIGEKLSAWEKLKSDLNDQIANLTTELRKKSKDARKRVTDAALSERIKLLKLERRAAQEGLKAERLLIKEHPALKERSTELHAETTVRVKAARAASGLYWGTYLLVERAVEAARMSKLDPRFKRFDSTGRVGVQFQGGITVAELFGNDTRMQLGALPDDVWNSRSSRRTKARSSLKLRIGSDGRAPIWAEFERVAIHRPLPKDAKIGWAWVKVSRAGPHLSYELQLTLESEQFVREPPLKNSERVAAMDLGWRTLPSGDIRVGYVYDAFVKETEIKIPGSITTEIAKADSIRAINDGHFNTARAVLKRWMKEHPEAMPDWLAEETATMHAWCARGRLSRLSRRLTAEMPFRMIQNAWFKWYTEHRRPVDRSLPYMKRRAFQYHDLFGEFSVIAAWLGGSPLENLTFYLDLWARQEKHLWEMETAKRSNVVSLRKDIYRKAAHALSEAYEYLVIEDFDLRRMAQKPLPEAEEGNVPALHSAMKGASPNELRLALESKMGKQRLVRIDASYTTRDHCCGHRNESELFKLEAQHSILATCDGCGEVFDQDLNAAKNLLARHLSPLPPPVASEKKEPTARVSSPKGRASKSAATKPQPMV